jgi:hypothetical protein
MILLKKLAYIILIISFCYSCAHKGETKDTQKKLAEKSTTEKTFWDRWLWGFNIFDFDFNMNLPVFNDIKLSFRDGDSYGIKLDYEYEKMNVDLNVKKLPTIGASPKSQKTYYLRMFDDRGPSLDFTQKTGKVRAPDKRVEKRKFPFGIGLSAEYVVPEIDLGVGSVVFRGVPNLSFRTYFKYNFIKVSLISIPLVSDKIKKTRRKALGIHVAQSDMGLFVGYEEMTGFRERETGLLNDNLTLKIFRMDYTYAFEDHYSIKRFTSFKPEEVGGSPLLKVTYRSSSIGDNEMIIPAERRIYFGSEGTLTAISSKTLSVLGGYGYAWNDQDGLLLAMKFHGGLSHHDNTLELMGGVKSENSSINEVFDGEFRFGYAYGKWVVSTMFSFDYETRSVSDLIEITGVKYKFSFFDIRYRFGVSDIAEESN